MAKKKVEQQQLRIEYVPLDEVVRWPRNPRQHDDAALERSLKRYGFTQPLMLDEGTGKLVAGHGRLGALESLRDSGEKPPERVQVGAGGRWLVPVIRGITFADPNEAESYLLADNRLSELGGWDMDGLREILDDLVTADVELDAVGWSDAAIARLLADEEPKKRKGKGDDGSGSTLDDLSGVNANARLVPIYLDASTYQPTLDRMQRVMSATKLPDYTALLLFLLDHYDATKPGKATGADPFAV